MELWTVPENICFFDKKSELQEAMDIKTVDVLWERDPALKDGIHSIRLKWLNWYMSQKTFPASMLCILPLMLFLQI